MLKKSVILLFLLLPMLSFAQRWKKYRYEFSAGTGASNFLGDLGGADAVGTDYLSDINFSQTQPILCFGLKYRIHDYFALKSNFIYASVAGSDSQTNYPDRHNRNLHFYSNIYEFSTQFEFSWRKEQVGHIYKLRSRGVKGQNAFSMFSYGFIGIGSFYFNPKADYYGETYVLQPLGTEGQGIYKSRPKYSRVGIVIPFGAGVRHSINQKWGVGLEYGIRKTFTDYIDDVSRTYAEGDMLLKNGDIVPKLANQTGEITDDKNIKQGYAPSQQRGDWTDKDSYMFLTFTVTYKIRNGRDNLPKF